ncbi:MAG TPA: MerR family transcriptional regulator [Solirubrobacterales bacterium]|jgi:MerR family redox-sensitive transcriptional activator SoxR|nr:MerR family transcriptional regulator [Solirubrobacterales bacterium]
MDATLPIGEVARLARLNVSAIRFYERKGLLPEPERVGGKRRYDEGTVDRLGTIEVAKQAGFSLAEIGILLDSVDRGEPAHEQLSALAARKLPEVEALIARAEAMRDWLTVASDCGCDSLDRCALFGDDAKVALPAV